MLKLTINENNDTVASKLEINKNDSAYSSSISYASTTNTDKNKTAVDLNAENKSESYEICFVPDNDYRAFLRHKVSDLDERIGPGNFVLSNGKVVGKHLGYPYYTIGQRKGLGIALGEPMFVTRILPESNTVMLGTQNELEQVSARVKNLNLVKYESILNPLEAVTKVRYKDVGTLSTIVQDGNELKIDFHHAVSGIAPGQSAVFYEGSDLLGGGFLM